MGPTLGGDLSPTRTEVLGIRCRISASLLDPKKLEVGIVNLFSESVLGLVKGVFNPPWGRTPTRTELLRLYREELPRVLNLLMLD